MLTSQVSPLPYKISHGLITVMIKLLENSNLFIRFNHSCANLKGYVYTLIRVHSYSFYPFYGPSSWKFICNGYLLTKKEMYLILYDMQCHITCSFVIKLVQKISVLIESISKWSTVEFEIQWAKWVWINRQHTKCCILVSNWLCMPQWIFCASPLHTHPNINLKWPMHVQFYWGNIIDINCSITDFWINTTNTWSITLYNVELLTITLIVYGGLYMAQNDQTTCKSQSLKSL